MGTNDIRMCVADAMQYDEIESIESVLHMINNANESSLPAARGKKFAAEEVKVAIRDLLKACLVTPGATGYASA